MAKRTKSEGSGPRPQLKAIKVRLDQLHGAATVHDMTIVATLIGAASEAVADEMSQRNVVTFDNSYHYVQ